MTETLGCVQNTVMAGLYLVFATRLTAAAKRHPGNAGLQEVAAGARAGARSELGSLGTWFGVDKPSADDALLSTSGSGDPPALVRERVGTYAELVNRQYLPTEAAR